jgi:hypothetical protein
MKQPKHCFYCGKDLQPGEWTWAITNWGQRVIVCKDNRECSKPPPAQHSHKLAVLLSHQDRWGWMA